MPWLWGLSLALASGVVHVLVWAAGHAGPSDLPEVSAPLPGVAYNGFSRWQSPAAGELPTAEVVREDLARIRPLTRSLRTYTTTESPALFEAAAAAGFEITAGLWLSNDLRRNEAELAAARAVELRYPGLVRQWLVGNETQLLGMVSPRSLRDALREARAVLSAPVSTAEPWHIWESNPWLVREVDFIGVHLLPYWEGVPLEVAAGMVVDRYRALAQRYPGRRIVVAEVGWPSGGGSFGAAEASPTAQARFVREVLARWHAMQSPPEAFLMEAIDQPWKGQSTEGPVGAHWGLLDAARVPKFSLSGDANPDPSWRWRALAASILGASMVVLLVVARSGIGRSGEVLMAVALQGASGLMVAFLAVPLANYPSAWDWAVLLGLLPPLALMAAVVLGQMFELLGSRRAERLSPRMPAPDAPLSTMVSRPGERHLGAEQPLPGVSIHMACANEDPSMVMAGVRSLLSMRYPRLEVVLVDNNTRDRRLSDELEEWCRALADPRLKFIGVETLPGFKAGALNLALHHTADWAQWIAVVDADYVVHPDWLADALSSDPGAGCGLLQYPQAHRLSSREAESLLARGMDTELESFFASGMLHRQAHGAALQHGTMCLIRRAALVEVGGWSSATLCEDSELGLRLLQAGHRVEYRPRVAGEGQLPAHVSAYARQRSRWAQGAMQILCLHGWSSAHGCRPRLGLRSGQAYHFWMGWAGWLTDGLHTLFSIAAVAWTVALIVQGGDGPGMLGLPLDALWMPLAVFWAARLVLGPWQMRMQQPHRRWSDIAAATLMGVALTPTIGVSVLRGMAAGIGRRALVFQGTRAGPAPTGAWQWLVRLASALTGPAMLALALGFAWAVGVGLLDYDRAPAWAWSLLLTALALPYVAASSVGLWAWMASEKGALGQPSKSAAR